MYRANNYSITFHPDRPTQEQDSFTCGHCSKVVFTAPGQRGEDAGGLCKCCMNLICGPCVDMMMCDIFEKKLERAEARDRFLRSAGI